MEKLKQTHAQVHTQKTNNWCACAHACVYVMCLQLKRLEDELHGSELQKQLAALERKTVVLEEERRECMEKCSRTETEAKDLRFTGTHTHTHGA